MVTLIEQFASPSEKEILLRITKECILSATLLPIFSVGVQVSNAGHFICHLISSYLLIPSLSNLSFSLPSFLLIFFLPSFLLLFLLLLFQSLLQSLCVLVFLSHPTLSSPLLSLSISFLIPSSSLHTLAFLIRSFLSLSKLSSSMFLSSSLIWPLLLHVLVFLSHLASLIWPLLLHVLVSLSHLASPLSQGDRRSYNYVAALSSDDEIPWDEIMTLAKLIPRVCHNINRYSIPYVHYIW